MKALARLREDKRLYKLPDIAIRKGAWGFATADGHVDNIYCGSSGWSWEGKEGQLNTFLCRIAASSVKKEFINVMEGNDITFDILKRILLRNVVSKHSDDGLYVLTGDNLYWRFGDFHDIDTHSCVEYLRDIKEVPNNIDIETLTDKAWRVFKDIDYEEFISENPDIKEMLEEAIADSESYEEYFEELDKIEFRCRGELVPNLREERFMDAILEAVKQNDE